jgi:hypothetical protein
MKSTAQMKLCRSAKTKMKKRKAKMTNQQDIDNAAAYAESSADTLAWADALVHGAVCAAVVVIAFVSAAKLMGWF